MDLVIKGSGRAAPPSTPLGPADPSVELKRCFDAYERSMFEYERYTMMVTSRDIQRDCERTSPCTYKFDIWKVAIGLNETAIKEAIKCIFSLAVEVATGKSLPFEISEMLYDMMFSSKDWISHQRRSNSRDDCGHLILNSTNESVQVSVDDICGRQQTTAQIAKYDDVDTLDCESKSVTQFVSQSSSIMPETDSTEETGGSRDSDSSDTTPNSEYGDFEMSSESRELFFKTGIVI